MRKYDLKNIKDENKVRYDFCLKSKKLHELIIKCGIEDVEIHANVKTIISQYSNEVIGSKEYDNLDLLYKYENKAPILSEIFEGYYDLENRVFWLNSKDFVRIVVDKEVEDGYTILVKENKAIGYCLKGGLNNRLKNTTI